MKNYDYLIIGAGLFGATFAHLAHKAGKKCLVIDKRSHTGGNLYCESIEGVNVHKYGAHIFHTSNKMVWNFVNSFVELNRYTNSPVANYKGKLYNLPFNMNTFYQIWGITTPDEARKIIDEQRRDVSEKLKRDGVDKPRNLEEQALMLIGKDIYNILIKGYTEKQWGRPCCELPSFIIRRLPIRFVFDNNYFDDKYQGIPIGGYNALFDGLLKEIEYKTDCDFFADRGYWLSIADKIVYTGKIDEFFEYRFGKLQYRTVHFEESVIETPNYQGNAVVNYTDRETPFTRIIEHKHFEKFGHEVLDNPKTVISKEYSVEWKEGLEPYYPVNDIYNSKLYQRYRVLAEKEDRVIFGGRLAEYRYYDMAPTIDSAFNLFKTYDKS